MRTLSNRLLRLEQGMAAQLPIWVRMQDAETKEQARVRWLKEHPDRKAELERGGVLFIRRVIVDRVFTEAGASQ